MWIIIGQTRRPTSTIEALLLFIGSQYNVIIKSLGLGEPDCLGWKAYFLDTWDCTGNFPAFFLMYKMCNVGHVIKSVNLKAIRIYPSQSRCSAMLAAGIIMCQTSDWVAEFSQFCNVETVIISLLQMRKLKPREIRSPIQNHTIKCTMHFINLATTLNVVLKRIPGCLKCLPPLLRVLQWVSGSVGNGWQ